jgi:hypothetical protein
MKKGETFSLQTQAIGLNWRGNENMLKGNESQDIYDAAKQWFYC